MNKAIFGVTSVFQDGWLLQTSSMKREFTCAPRWEEKCLLYISLNEEDYQHVYIVVLKNLATVQIKEELNILITTADCSDHFKWPARKVLTDCTPN